MDASPYDVLGVREDASAAEIRRAYLAQARRFHPDRVDPSLPGAEDAGDRMRAVNEAWAVLGDAVRRRRYDDAQPRPFRPLHDDDPDEPDPRLAPDLPYRASRPETPLQRAITTAPILLFFASVTVGSLGVVLSAAPLVGLAVLLFACACIGFVAIPLLALGRASRDMR